MVPTMIGMVLSHPEFRPERLAIPRAADLRRLADAGGAPRQAARRCTPTSRSSQGYGMTEASAVLTFLTARRPPPRAATCLRSAGRPVPGVAALDPGRRRQPGARRARPARCAPGPATSCGSTGTSPRPPRRSFRGGWYHTGDAGYLDDEGYLFLVDRVKDMIVTGGENVYSAEVENAISKHPAVAQVAVIGIPHEQWGEQVHAIVVLRRGRRRHRGRASGPSPRSRSPATRCRSRSSSATEPLPLSGAMKVLKKDLRAPYWEGRERAVN